MVELKVKMMMILSAVLWEEVQEEEWEEEWVVWEEWEASEFKNDWLNLIYEQNIRTKVLKILIILFILIS
jgi:hypothetical protein